jgi:hypothetical protein
MPTDEQIAAARQQARDTIDHVEDVLANATTVSERRQWQRPEPEPPRDRKDRTSVRSQPEPEPDWSGWEKWADAKIANAIAAEREFVLEVVGQAIGEMLDKGREEARKALALQVAELKVELAKTRTVLAEAKLFAATGDRRSVLDLPNPLRPKTQVN